MTVKEAISTLNLLGCSDCIHDRPLGCELGKDCIAAKEMAIEALLDKSGRTCAVTWELLG